MMLDDSNPLRKIVNQRMYKEVAKARANRAHYVLTADMINKHMQKLGITQKEFATRCGINEAQFSRFTTAQQLPEGANEWRICDEVGLRHLGPCRIQVYAYVLSVEDTSSPDVPSDFYSTLLWAEYRTELYERFGARTSITLNKAQGNEVRAALKERLFNHPAHAEVMQRKFSDEQAYTLAVAWCQSKFDAVIDDDPGG
jgi:transcriptional regulator with XRE-family HTH domain